jgi:2-C-methyl-D-erythritol 4-phosphate cytidylyltransferase
MEAIVVAAGEGLRMRSDTRKQYLSLDGIPVIARSVNLFLNYITMGKVVLVVPDGEAGKVKDLLEPHCLPDRIELTAGGKTRQESVFRGLQVISADCDLICIHDAARPLASGLLLERLIEAALKFGAAVPVVALNDTVKEVNSAQMIVGTPPRDRLRLVQTPQVFKADLIRFAYSEALKSGTVATDDASLVELLGKQVASVQGELSNLKITAPVDLTIASWYLRGATDQ